MPPATLFVVFIFEVSEMSMGITTKKVLLALGLASAVAGFSMNAAFAADDEDHPVCQEGQKCDKPMSGNKKMDKKITRNILKRMANERQHQKKVMKVKHLVNRKQTKNILVKNSQ